MKPIAHWQATLASGDVTVTPVKTTWELFDERGLREAGLIVTTESADYGTVEHVGVPHRLSRTPASNGRPTPPPGSDAIAILTEAGIDGLVVRALIESGIVRNSEG
jgi:crotonobetainyl-CoA:carnitine CoA-transferase CaiB-like acyl-CoA transferase